MREALRDAGLAPRDVGFVSAHGTGTLDNDRVEALAVSRLFGETVPVSSTMRFFGHTLAASGAMKAVLCVEALLRGRLPANLGLREPLEGARLDFVREPREARPRFALSNSFGFGGNNGVLVFAAAEALP
jgi:3-oxoacyl-(acyl-carrier-protein) synthase